VVPHARRAVGADVRLLALVERLDTVGIDATHRGVVRGLAQVFGLQRRPQGRAVQDRIDASADRVHGIE
jgi:hypothetical protein